MKDAFASDSVRCSSLSQRRCPEEKRKKKKKTESGCACSKDYRVKYSPNYLKRLVTFTSVGAEAVGWSGVWNAKATDIAWMYLKNKCYALDNHHNCSPTHSQPCRHIQLCIDQGHKVVQINYHSLRLQIKSTQFNSRVASIWFHPLMTCGFRHVEEQHGKKVNLSYLISIYWIYGTLQKWKI